MGVKDCSPDFLVLNSFFFGQIVIKSYFKNFYLILKFVFTCCYTKQDITGRIVRIANVKENNLKNILND